MKKTILITGSTDGIGFATAATLVKLGHKILLHGRNIDKLANAKEKLASYSNEADIETYIADLSILAEVKNLATAITEKHQKLDAVINNAGIYSVPNNITENGLDPRFVVNTIAPYFLTKLLLPLLNESGRVINLSSAAQAPFNPVDLAKPSLLANGTVYAQSKLALTMWSRQLALSLDDKGPIIVAINPASMLGSNMVKQAFGVAGNDLQIGADILVKAALSETFSKASGLYFDNDIGEFSLPHPDAVNPEKIARVTHVIDNILQDNCYTNGSDS
jgi:NAD(P)-dependent dehydrogenase (short-subunit alcohol dehydrogenase family)